MKKTWEEISKEVEQECLARFNRVPITQRAKLGIEPGSDIRAYENRQWVQCYIQMLAWKDKCRELHAELSPLKLVACSGKSCGNKKNKKRK